MTSIPAQNALPTPVRSTYATASSTANAASASASAEARRDRQRVALLGPVERDDRERAYGISPEADGAQHVSQRRTCRAVTAIPLATARPLRKELERALPQRPFTVWFWQGTELRATLPPGAPKFTVRSLRAFAHPLRAPGQLGLGPAYVAGDLEVDDMDAMIALLDGWKLRR